MTHRSSEGWTVIKARWQFPNGLILTFDRVSSLSLRRGEPKQWIKSFISAICRNFAKSFVWDAIQLGTMETRIIFLYRCLNCSIEGSFVFLSAYLLIISRLIWHVRDAVHGFTAGEHRWKIQLLFFGNVFHDFFSSALFQLRNNIFFTRTSLWLFSHKSNDFSLLFSLTNALFRQHLKLIYFADISRFSLYSFAPKMIFASSVCFASPTTSDGHAVAKFDWTTPRTTKAKKKGWGRKLRWWQRERSFTGTNRHWRSLLHYSICFFFRSWFSVYHCKDRRINFLAEARIFK